jgi:UDP-glucose 4-epimerase
MSLQSSDRAKVVAVTGASGYVGSSLLRELEEEGLERIVALDIRPLQNPVHNVALLNRSVVQPLGEIFREHRVDTVVHLAFVMRPSRRPSEAEAARGINVGGMENVLRACRSARVKHLIYLSSHTVYGAHRGNPIPITEEAPLRPNRGFQYAEHKVLCEEAIRRFSQEYRNTRITILRTCVVMGPTAQNYITQALDKPMLVGVLGNDPPMQFVHDNDVARVITLMTRDPHPGIYNVAGERTVRYSRMTELAHRRLIHLPAALLYPMTQITWELGIQKDSPAVGLNFIRFPLIVSTGKLKGITGFRFRYTSEEALASYALNIDEKSDFPSL